MARTQRRTYRMTLSQFQRYVRDKLRELEKCYQEVEEVRQQFDEIFKREMQAWQEVFAYCYPRVAAQRHELPAPFPEIFARTEKEERLRLQKEIADLKGEIQKGQSQMDELMAQAQSTIEKLRKANPELNEREERLKALM
ncbi:MAG TPA: hypothetical protein ENF86_01315, partial [Firmicutes bacterium]|nr:hypothetical protein [Bacillota bacterium]